MPGMPDVPDFFSLNCVAGVVFQRLRFRRLHLRQADALLDANALRTRINAVAALCGRSCLICRQHASGNRRDCFPPYLDSNTDLTNPEATLKCCLAGPVPRSRLVPFPIDSEST